MNGLRKKRGSNKRIYTKENLKEMVALCVEEVIQKLKNGEITFKIDESAKEMLEGIERRDLVWLDRDYAGISKNPSYLNPLTLYMRGPIREGLIRTYPPDTAIRYLKDYFDFENFQIKKVRGYNGVEKIKVTVLNINHNVEDVEKAMSLCGYYLSFPRKENLPENSAVLLIFEPLRTSEETEKIRAEAHRHKRNGKAVLLHLTPAYKLGKIRNIGLCPRFNNEYLKYPERIYFLNGATPEEYIENLGRQLSGSNPSPKNNGEYVLLAIDLDKVPGRNRFFLDPNYPFACYSLDNIPPEAVIPEKKFKF